MAMSPTSHLFRMWYTSRTHRGYDRSVCDAFYYSSIDTCIKQNRKIEHRKLKNTQLLPKKGTKRSGWEEAFPPLHPKVCKVVSCKVCKLSKVCQHRHAQLFQPKSDVLLTDFFKYTIFKEMDKLIQNNSNRKV